MNKTLLKTSLVTLSAAVCLSACATASKSDMAEASGKTEMQVETQQLAEVSNSDEKVCRRTIVSGTRFTKKVCRTQAEWDDMAADAQRGTAAAQQAGSIQRKKGG